MANFSNRCDSGQGKRTDCVFDKSICHLRLIALGYVIPWSLRCSTELCLTLTWKRSLLIFFVHVSPVIDLDKDNFSPQLSRGLWDFPLMEKVGGQPCHPRELTLELETKLLFRTWNPWLDYVWRRFIDLRSSESFAQYPLQSWILLVSSRCNLILPTCKVKKNSCCMFWVRFSWPCIKFLYPL